ncbi:hypothetical protein PROFUN_10912 [Planoprotostelium fungivorum]|uniref:Uncharacterized protein n=1 Tax=Planoprotostelium fungivorum TaxID=1890364 RepID=A0A2P6NC76_9EUKA|nr:hypothetical protein PROFUN_10912 [Planoprotostelium fungivorum]
MSLEYYAQLSEHFLAISQIYRQLSGGGPIHTAPPVRRRKNLAKLGISNFPTYDELLRLQKAIREGEQDPAHLMNIFEQSRGKHGEHVIQLFTKAFQLNGGKFIDRDYTDDDVSSDEDDLISKKQKMMHNKQVIEPLISQDKDIMDLINTKQMSRDTDAPTTFSFSSIGE